MNHPYESNMNANLYIDKRLNEAGKYRQAKKYNKRQSNNLLINFLLSIFR